ncbi:hypothetical protein [Saccharicrinis sp. GN24d3]
MRTSKGIIQKVYATLVIVLLVGVLAMQNEKVFGIEFFADKTEGNQTEG